MLTEIDQMRIAIALIALKFKPDDQSVASYVIDLRSRFPASVRPAPTSDGSWRTHALRLENEYASLKAKYDAEKTKTLALSSAPCMPQSMAQPATEITKRKLKKKNALPTVPMIPARPDLKSILEELNPRSGIPTLTDPWPGTLVTTLDSFFRLASLRKESQVPLEKVVLSTQCALDAICASLKNILQCDCISKPQLHLLKALDPLAQDVIATALPIITSPLSAIGPLDYFLAATRKILLPPIQSFLPLSIHYLQRALFACPKSSNTHRSDTDSLRERSVVVDIRPDTLALFRNVLYTLFGSSSRSRDTKSSILSRLCGVLRFELDNLRMSLALEAIRELDRVLFSVDLDSLRNNSNNSDRESESCSSSPTETIPSVVREARVEVLVARNDDDDFLHVKKLAVKDTLWYLCTLLHVLSGDNVLSDSEAAQDVYDIEFEKSANTQTSHSAPGDTRIAHEKTTKSFQKAIEIALLELIVKCQKSEEAIPASHYLAIEKEARMLHQESLASKELVFVAVDVAGSPTQGKDVNANEPKVRIEDDSQRRSSLGNGSRVGDCLSEERPRKGIGNRDAGRWPQVMSVSGQSRPVDLPLVDHSQIPARCPVDEVGYGMILGVLERYLIGVRGR